MSTPPIVSCAAAVLALAANAVSAQTPIQADRPVQGTLTASSAKADDGTPYDLYLYRGEAGQRLRITMESDAFDTYLAAGSTAAPGCGEDCRTDDDGGEGTNSSLIYTLPADGTVQIRANSIFANGTGPYTLAVSVLPPAPTPQRRSLQLGQAVEGRLGPESSLDDEDHPYDVWTVTGSPGQEIVIRLDSDDFDAVVEFGSWRDGRFVQSALDDDGGGGTNARLKTRLDSRGNGTIKARSFSGRDFGSYRLHAGDPPQARPIQVVDAVVGEAIRGRLDEGDAFTPDEEIRFDVYRIQGRPGQRVIARMESTDFDPLLRWGTFEGETFQEESMDDDGGGGSSAQLTVILDEDGLGRLVATAYGGGLGNYTLSLLTLARGQP